MSSDTRKFVASGFLVLVLLALIAYLTFVPVPAGSKDLVVAVLGVLVGAGSAAIPNLVGDQSTETKELREKLEDMSSDLKKVRAQYIEVKSAYDTIVQMLITRHVVDAKGIEIPACDIDEHKHTPQA